MSGVVVSAAIDAAAGAHTEYSSAVCKRCYLCGDASTYQTSTSGVMIDSAGKAAPAKQLQAVGSANCSHSRAHNQKFIYVVHTKDTSDEKGQAMYTRVHATL